MNIENELLSTLDGLIDRWEMEIVEFKEASNDYDKNKIGQYFSAISNEANLQGSQFGWLVFGVRNRDRKIVGTDYRSTAGLDKLKQEISIGTTGNVTYIGIYEVFPVVDGISRRVIMFKIPAAPTAMPTAWQGHYYSRNGESLTSLSIEKLERIRRQHRPDWSKQLVEGSSIEYLDKTAINVAREKYKNFISKSPHIAEEIDAMTDEQFLSSLQLMVSGKVTNACMVLLGKGSYDHVIEPTPKIMWRLYSSAGENRDHELFSVPFLMAVDKVREKIRNLTYRYMPNQLTLFPTETQQYDSWLLRELINNSIAHQDYTVGGRIYINEFEDKIQITNPGSFLPGRIERVLELGYAPPYYKNSLLADAMVKFQMIDTATSGIRRVFSIQKEKYFPLPDYDLSQWNLVSATVYGRVLNESYTKVLFSRPELTLHTVFLLDRVQKHRPISKQDIAQLRMLGVVEGKASQLYISAEVAELIDDKAQYIRNRSFDDQYYKDMITSYLGQFGKADRQQINDLIFDKLPDSLSGTQKKDKITNLLSSMRRARIIERDSPNQRSGNWILMKSK